MAKWSDPERVAQVREATARQIQELEAQVNSGTLLEGADQQLEMLRQRARQLEEQEAAAQAQAQEEKRQARQAKAAEKGERKE